MKKSLLSIIALASLTLLTGCFEKTSTTTTKTSTAPATTEKKEDTTKKDSTKPTEPTEPTTPTFDIANLKKGYTADVTKEDDGEKDIYKVGVGTNIVNFKDYTTSSSKEERENGWDGKGITLRKAISYQPVTVEGDNASYFGRAYYDACGKVVTAPVNIKDATTGNKSPVEWQYMNFDNFFTSLENSDFAVDSNGNYALDLTAAKFTDDLKENIKNLVYPGYDDETGKYSSYSLDSFVLTVDDKLVPTGYIANLTGSLYSWSAPSTLTFTASFTDVGENVVSALTELKTNSDFEAVLTKLKANNYKFQASKYIAGGPWSSASSYFYSGEVDGTTVTYTDGADTTGYTKVDDTQYRQFDASSSKKVYSSTESTEGDMFADILSTFDFNSSILKKISAKTSDDGVDVYTFSLDDYFLTGAEGGSRSLTSSIFTPKFVKGYATTLSTKLKVIVSDDEIEFNIQDEDDPRILDVRYFGFGSVETYDVSKITEPTA